jgi:hypothetical protein
MRVLDIGSFTAPGWPSPINALINSTKRKKRKKKLPGTYLVCTFRLSLAGAVKTGWREQLLELDQR